MGDVSTLIFSVPSGNGSATIFDWSTILSNRSDYPGINGYYSAAFDSSGNYLGSVCFQDGASYSFTFVTGEGNAGSGIVTASVTQGGNTFSSLLYAYATGGTVQLLNSNKILAYSFSQHANSGNGTVTFTRITI